MNALQILTQVSGRAGHRPLGGNVVLQSYQPDHWHLRQLPNMIMKVFTRTSLHSEARLVTRLSPN